MAEWFSSLEGPASVTGNLRASPLLGWKIVSSRSFPPELRPDTLTYEGRAISAGSGRQAGVVGSIEPATLRCEPHAVLMTGASPRNRVSVRVLPSHGYRARSLTCGPSVSRSRRQRGGQRAASRALIGSRPRSSSRSSGSRSATARRWWHEPRWPVQAPALPPAGRPSRWRSRARR